jgi:hypothetical protein
MDEDADTDENVVGLGGGNCAIGDAVCDRNKSLLTVRRWHQRYIAKGWRGC